MDSKTRNRQITILQFIVDTSNTNKYVTTYFFIEIIQRTLLKQSHYNMHIHSPNILGFMCVLYGLSHTYDNVPTTKQRINI